MALPVSIGVLGFIALVATLAPAHGIELLPDRSNVAVFPEPRTPNVNAAPVSPDATVSEMPVDDD